MARTSLQRSLLKPTPLVPIERTHRDGVLVAFGFRCNLACTFCMVEDVLGQRPGTDLATFRTFAADRQQTRGVRRIVLSGGEATLEENLLEYVAVARSIDTVAHVRLQTNATRLGAGPLLRQLIDTGVDEFFVSLHACDEAGTAAITQRTGTFAAIAAGLDAVAASPARLFTNTCMVQQNHKSLLDIVRFVAPRRPAGMDFWNLWPRVDTPAVRSQLVPLEQLVPPLLSALDECQVRAIPATVKWVPRCVLGRHAHCQDDSQPTTLIDGAYWQAVPPYACLWSGSCAHAQTGCSGLAHAYVETFGWEETRLRPSRPESLAEGQAPLAEGQAPLAEGKAGTDAALDAFATAHGLAVGERLGAFRVHAITRHQAGLRWLLVGDGAQLTVDVRRRDDRLPAWRRTAALDISHGPVAATTTADWAAVLPVFLERLATATALP